MKEIAISIPGFGKIDSGLPSGVPTGGLDTTGVKAIVVGIEFLIIVAILLSLYYIVRGGINIITSGGDKEKFQMGRERVRYAIIGLLIIFFSFAIMNILGAIFNINLLFFIK